MSDRNSQFDEKDVLIAGDIDRIRPPTLQRKRIRKNYAAQFREESAVGNEEGVSRDGGVRVAGGTEGRSVQAISPDDMQEEMNDLQKAVRKRKQRRLARSGDDLPGDSFYRFRPRGGSREIRPVEKEEAGRYRHLFAEKATSTFGSANFSEGRYAASPAGGGVLFYSGGAASLQHEEAAFRELRRKQLQRTYAAKRNDTVYIPFVTGFRERMAARRAAGETEKAAAKAADEAGKHPLFMAVLIIVLLIVLIISMAVSAGVTLVGEVHGAAIVATSYSAEDEDILGAEADYAAMEAELRAMTADPEHYYPGYQNYELHNTEIGHDPYRLAALLTVLHERFTRREVQDSLTEIFNAQYAVETEDITGVSEQRTVRVGESLGTVVTSGYCNCEICCGVWSGGATASGVMPVSSHTIAVDSWDPIVPMGTRIVMNGIEYTVEDTGPLSRYGVAFDVYYDDHQAALNHGHRNWEAFIADDNGTETVTVTVTNTEPTLKVTVRNHGLDHAARQLLNDDLYERYQLIAEMKGNRPDLFPEYNAASVYGDLVYAPPGSALSDRQFANVYHEAVKYLGVQYVWGGETPDGFDCSGFVSYVINHCGNGWNYGRLTAEEWRQATMYVSPSEAKPGDLIFFQGTYDTAGASHIGIYMGDGIMIHCGHPVQFASVNDPYFRQHFLSYGRIPS